MNIVNTYISIHILNFNDCNPKMEHTKIVYNHKVKGIKPRSVSQVTKDTIQG